MPRLHATQDTGPAAESRFAASLPLGERLAQRGLLAPSAIPKFLSLQRRWGCRFGEVLVAEGTVRPVELAECLADGLGLAFVDLNVDPPDETLIERARHSLYLRKLFVPWRKVGGALVVACADPSPSMRRLIARLYGPLARLAVTSKFDIIWTVQRLFRERLDHDATYRLDERARDLSARRVLTRPQIVLGASAAVVLGAALWMAPELAAAILFVLIGICYGANILLRVLLFGTASLGGGTGRCVTADELAELEELYLPTYSILVPLYREANMVRPLAAALKELDYPAAKLDIKLVLEEDDADTIRTAKALHLDGRFEILIVPRSFLRTKPRACNYALRFIRGAYVVIYDAEDRPEPDQLKKAVAAFRTAPPDVACFQARLNVYNAEDNWLTRMFALEYAAWFDFFLPGLARLGIPIPLGGTSNHFRAEILGRVCAWDAFNVTEDADLGVRLARLGYRVAPIDSTTFEEATPTLCGWLRQRSRWLKGYMQTALVHLRDPLALGRAIGILPTVGFVVFVFGAVATSLLSPLLWALAGVFAVGGSESWFGPYGPLVTTISQISLIGGHCLLTLLAMLAPLKRRWFHLAPYGASVCLYWLLISVAAYRGLWQLMWRPFYWEKTQHGLARRARPLERWQVGLARVAPIVTVLICFAAEVAMANPWPKEQGATELVSSLSFTRQEAGLASGAVGAASSTHLEYGATTRTTLVLDSQVQRLMLSGQSQTRFDSASAGIRTVLRRGDFSVLSFQLDAGVAGVRRSAFTAETGINGRGGARLMFGQGFEILRRHAFAGVEAGWQWRGGAPADEIVFDMGAGIEPWASGLVMLQSFTIISYGEARGAYRRYDLSKLQVSVAQRLTPSLWVQIGAVSSIAGADRGQAGGLLGFWWRL